MAFKGYVVCLSRSLVPPEKFDSLCDALRLNGAEVLLCCDPSRSSPNDYHVISSPDHEKFETLRAKGCNLVGPECVLSCAKEHKGLPKQGYTCCLAMDGVKVLASGFDKEEKVKIEKLVTAMGGVLHTKASRVVSFVIMKNVLAAKYKWASSELKKPIVTVNWLYQCWNEHRIVPQEPYRVLPFTGLTICATGIPGDERKEMKRLILQNGGQYSADLTRNCTHLVSNAAEGDKYKVARNWGHIHIVNQKWFHQSISERVCLDEDSYPVQGPSILSKNAIKGGQKRLGSQEKGDTSSQSVPSTVLATQESLISRNTSSTISDATVFTKERSEVPSLNVRDGAKSEACVADDSQTEDNDLYLADCRILLVGFQATKMRKLVNMVRKGGGSRYMSFGEKLTHIILGSPSEIEKKEVRQLAAWGVIHVVSPVWLEDCSREKKEVPVSLSHLVSDILLPKDSACYNEPEVTGVSGAKQGKNFMGPFSTDVQVSADASFESGPFPELVRDLSKERAPETNLNANNSVERSTELNQKWWPNDVNGDSKGRHKLQCDTESVHIQQIRVSNIFRGRSFRFSSSFPEDQRAEIVEWVNQGGGLIVDDHGKQNADFTVERHGLIPRSSDLSQSTIVSSHWIRSCLEEGNMPDVGSHILYSPLPCRIPFPGYERIRFCVSQYESKDRMLLRNMCFVLGAKFTEKLSQKVTHLICKFTDGPKYDAAFKWGIESITSEWITECIRQNKMVPLDPFRPKAVTDQDRDAGLCMTSQYPTQAARVISKEFSSQSRNQSQGVRSHGFGEEAEHSRVSSKKPRQSEGDICRDLFSAEISLHQDIPCNKLLSAKVNDSEENLREASCDAATDVAAVIEDWLAKSDKIQDMKPPGRTGSDQIIFSPERSILGQDHTDFVTGSTFGISKHWLNRTEKLDDTGDALGNNRKKGTYDGFSETQNESQIVGYEEDLTGKQMIIERMRTRSSSLSAGRENIGEELINDDLERLLRVANESRKSQR